MTNRYTFPGKVLFSDTFSDTEEEISLHSDPAETASPDFLMAAA